MARIHDLLRSVATTNEGLADEIRREIDATYGRRRAFGLNFERHTPEAVELPGRAVRKGDKVHVLPPRGETVKAENKVMWFVESVDRKKTPATAEIVRQIDETEFQELSVDIDDLVVVAEFRDPIYPGLVSTGKVERGGDKPYHSVINAENFHALQALLFTHRGKVDVIYIDPPYNTGAKDWKYNNDYVEADDAYRHSKWLAFMERRLLLAKELLNPDDSSLIVTIDEKEFLRLGLLLEQIFENANITMVTSSINPGGSPRRSTFSRAAEYLFYVQFGESSIRPLPLSGDWIAVKNSSKEDIHWHPLQRTGQSKASTREGRPNLFFPIYICDGETGPVFHSVGEPYFGSDFREVGAPTGTVAIWPIKSNGVEGRWGVSAQSFRELIKRGYAKLGSFNHGNTAVYFLQDGMIKKVENGEFAIIGRRPDGSIETNAEGYVPRFIPEDIWRISSHDASRHGSTLLKKFLPLRQFPFPKSLYAVEDALSFLVHDKLNATVVDFFSGSGTTAHALMRLNKQDGGRRISISVTNNEVSSDEQQGLQERGLRPGDAEWEKWGICDYITKPRIEAAITGKTPEGEPIQGDYKFTDEFPIAEGFEENVEFFTLTYESHLSVSQGLAFERISPMLWVRAGQTGRRIESLANGFDVADTYGVIADLDKTDEFVSAVAENDDVRIVFVITEEDRLFETVAQALPDHVEVVRLYDDYFRNFEVDAMKVDR